MKRFRDLAIFIFFSLGLLIVITGTLFNYYLSPVSEKDTEKEIEIKDGKDIDEITNTLYDNELIRNPKVFKIYLQINGIDELKEGSFTIKQNKSAREIAHQLEINNK